MPTWDDYNRVIEGYDVHIKGAVPPTDKTKPGWELFGDPVGQFTVSVGAAVKQAAARHGGVELSDVEINVSVGDRQMQVTFSKRVE